MSFNHPVSDLVATIKNGYLAQRSSIKSPVSKIREQILKVLKEEGYVHNYAKIKLNNHDYFNISLKYYNNKPVLSEICVISKPGRKIYCSLRHYGI